MSDRVMSLKLETVGVMLNVVSCYAPQVGGELDEKEKFWCDAEYERVVIGAHLDGHVGEEVMRKCWTGLVSRIGMQKVKWWWTLQKG